MKKEWGLVARPSTLAGAGLGLFFVGFKDKHTGEWVDALRKDDIVTYYSGKEVLTRAQYNERYPEDVHTDYGLCVSGKVCLDGGPTSNMPGRLINDGGWRNAADGRFVRSGVKPNVKFPGNARGLQRMFGRYVVPMKALKAIRAGDELLVAYGKAYWDDKNIAR